MGSPDNSQYRRLAPGTVLDAWVRSLTVPELAGHLARIADYIHAYPPKTRRALFREASRRLLTREARH